MRKILITGALGQIGTDLALYMRKQYGDDQVVLSDMKEEGPDSVMKVGRFEKLDVMDAQRMAQIVDDHKIDTIIHLAAILSAVAENIPQKAFQINQVGLFNVLEVAREKQAAVFTPSSIAAFGPSTPKEKTPQDTIQRPNTMYGVTKVAGELLCDYYHQRFGVDTRGVRFPGLISYSALPGGGTTDYAVDIFYEALKTGSYTSFIEKGTFMDMMYMPDALKAIHDLIEADPSKLVHRNAFNIAAMSFDPEQLAAQIRRHLPAFTLSYEVDPVRQAIADSWPNSLDDSAARHEWGWNPQYDLALMVEDMLKNLKIKLSL